MLDRVRSPGAIGTLELPHRIVMGAMHLGLEDADDDGRALAAFYTARARGGAGLIVTGGWAVSRTGAAGPHYGLVNDPAHHPRLALVAEEVHAAGGRIALQLFHAGRYATREAFGLQPVAPSAVPSRFSPEPPHALTEAEIAATIADFAAGAAAAEQLGFDAVELMGSEGYLLNQFVSPLTNIRDDRWGSDAAGRRAFPLAVLAAVRAAVGPDFPVIYRMSGADLMDGSTTDDETLALAADLAHHGADALNIGVGWHESPVPTVQTLVPGGVWTPIAARIKAAVGEVPVISGNRINRLEMAEELLRSGAADFVCMSRPFLADPTLIATGVAGRTVNVCIGCDQACIDRSLVDERVSCLVNPAAGAEAEPPVPPARPPRRVAVIGGGPAGLAAARELATIGHRVTLFEAEDELGGQFRMARVVPGKADYGATIVFYAAEIDRLGVQVQAATRLDAADPAALAEFDAAVLATGVRPRQVRIDGADLPHVIGYPAAFAAWGAGAGGHGVIPGEPGWDTVAIIGGGGIGVDLAHLISSGGVTADPARFRADYGLTWPGGDNSGASAGRRGGVGPGSGAAPSRTVTVMRRAGRIGQGIGRSTRWALVAALRRAGVRLLTGVEYRRIVPEGVWIGDADGREELIRADRVVIAAGGLPETELAPLLETSGLPYRTVGGARSTDRLDAVRAFAEGRSAARDLAAELAALPAGADH